MPFPPVLPDEYKHTGIAPFGSPGASFSKMAPAGVVSHPIF